MPVDELMTPLNNLFMAASLIMGLLVGSFCNVCVGRWPHGDSVVSPGSRCPKCMNAIAWFDNIPLLSWLLLGAKCRNCKAPISWQYPVVEALTGVLFLLVYLRFGMTWASPVYMALAAALVIVTFQDLADWTIPNEITLPGIPVGLGLSVVAMFLGASSGFRVIHPFDAVLGIVLGFGILYGLDRITVLLLKRPGMGMGDVKLLAMLGGFIGWQGVLGTVMIASMLGSVVGLSMILYFKTKGAPADAGEAPDALADAEAPKDKAAEQEDGEEDISLGHHYLPFGPYLAIGSLIYLFFGPELVTWYLSHAVGAQGY